MSLLSFLIGRQGLALVWIEVVRWQLTVESYFAVNSRLATRNGLLCNWKLFDVFSS